jgi:membrane associated rhomboid family serine protease
MSWQERQYNDGPYTPGPRPGGGGLRSWFGGLPSPGRAVKWIALANIAIYLLCLITGGWNSPIVAWGLMQTDLVMEGQVWRLFTFTYLHSLTSVWHILFNMLGLYFLGMPLERQWGSKRFFFFYTAGGFIAVLVYLVLTTVGWLDSSGILVGASGGVLATLGACAVLFPQFRIIFVFFPVPIRLAALLLVILYALNVGNVGCNAGGDACHLAGLVFGVFWAYRGHALTAPWRRWGEKVKRGAYEAKLRERHAMEQDIDRILKKVNEQGINSLSRREKQKLAEATRRQQEEDRRLGL